jgi:hypothetical protein
LTNRHAVNKIAIFKRLYDPIIKTQWWAHSWKTPTVRAIAATNNDGYPEAEAPETRLTEAELLAPAELDETSEAEELVEDWTELEVEARLVEPVPFEALMLV